MSGTIVGYTANAKGYFYFCYYTPMSSSVIGDTICVVSSEKEHNVGDTIPIYCRRSGGNYYFYERAI